MLFSEARRERKRPQTEFELDLSDPFSMLLTVRPTLRLLSSYNEARSKPLPQVNMQEKQASDPVYLTPLDHRKCHGPLQRSIYPFKEGTSSRSEIFLESSDLLDFIYET